MSDMSDRNNTNSKPKVAFFDLASCEGCQLQVANMGPELLDILQQIELVEFREVMSERWQGEYDVAFVEGSVINHEGEERLKQIRERSNLLVAYGSCAAIGGVNAIKDHPSVKKNCQQVYNGIYQVLYKGDCFCSTVGETRALDQIVTVDYQVPGCPVHPEEFIKVLKAILLGLPYQVPDYAVCVECIFNENICKYAQGVTCLGPITRAGCNAWCINNGNICYGCRGMVSNPNSAGAETVLQEYNLDPEAIAQKMAMYNGLKRRQRIHGREHPRGR